MDAFDRRLLPARPDLAAEHLRDTVAAERYAPARIMRVVEETLALAPKPSREVSIDTQALYGEEVHVYETTDEGWVWGQLASDGYVGYLPAEGLRASAQHLTHRIRVPRTLVYPGPNMKLPHVGALSFGAQVSAVRMAGDFAEVPMLGYVWRDHLAELSARESDFVSVAERFVGAPYLWGGKTSGGIDCSGLIQVSLAACGVASPRDTDLMEKALGTALDPAGASQLRRGDLVFWKGHIGVMQDGERLLHANGHHMLVVSEPFASARERIREKTGADVTSIRRL